MKRMKRHKIKTERAEASASYPREFEEHDLAYYIHDRVELMHQVFSILKYKDIKAIVPQSVRDLAVGDLQELCTEELLGISSKRLVAILDGAEPPSDTDSSSQSPTPDQMETISLDSISSDEEILSQSSKKKKHKHSKSKSRKKRDKQKAKNTVEAAPNDTTEVSKASRAGLTVLELLELQARARAIRAQLQNEQHLKKLSEQAVAEAASSDDEDAVEIKVETPDVVEISSGDEKPDIQALQAQVQNTAKQKEPPKAGVSKQKETAKAKEASKKEKAKKNSKQKVTKSKDSSEQKETTKHNELNEPEHETVVKEASQPKSSVARMVSDLTVTVPLTSSRKIKLNRRKLTVTVPNEPDIVTESKLTLERPDETKADKRKKLKKNKKKKTLEKDGSDHDEITLQLSDSEKMDLLEDWNEKSYEKLSSSADSESSSSDSDLDTSNENIANVTEAVNEESETGAKNNEEKADSYAESKIERVVDDKTETAQPEIEDITESNEQSESEPTETPDKQSNIVETINNEADDESNTNDKVLSPVTNSRELDKENDNDESVNIDDKIIDNNENVNADLGKSDIMSGLDIDSNVLEIKVRAEISNVSISKEVDNVLNDSDVTKNLQETQEITTEIQRDTDVPERIVTENIETQNKEKTKDLTETVQDGEIAQKGTEIEHTESILEISSIDEIPVSVEQNKEIEANVAVASASNKGKDKDISEGELSDRESSEVEAFDMETEVVCISDDDAHKSKKKKKKEKKAKKEKKSKKSKKDFRERADQNFYKDAHKLINTEIKPIDITDKQTHTNTEAIDIDKQTNIDIKAIDITDDDVYEFLELSDDSSCYEVEGTVLSKEPTAEEIAALSATIDDINEDGIESKDEEPIYDHSEPDKYAKHDDNASDESEKDAVMSWKERYLGSNKVKKVLTTANILNALRNKNKQLKKKMAESRRTVKEDNKTTECQDSEEITESNEGESQDIEKAVEDKIEEGSIEQYQTLPTLPKYVVTDADVEIVETETETDATKEIKRDAKQLFKMYKKLMYSKKAKRSEKKRLRKVRKRIER